MFVQMVPCYRHHLSPDFPFNQKQHAHCSVCAAIGFSLLLKTNFTEHLTTVSALLFQTL